MLQTAIITTGIICALITYVVWQRQHWWWRVWKIGPIARMRVVERMRDGVIVLDRHKRIVEINPAACTLIGKDRGQVRGQPIRHILKEHAGVIEQLTHTHEGDEEVVFGSGDERRIVQIQASSLQESGDPGGWMLILRNISGLKKTEQDLIKARMVAEKANAAKSTFLATVSHEIRTPMHGVLGMAELLAESNLSADQEELVEMIQTSGKQLMRIINMILDLSKIEADALDLEMQPFDLRACLESALDLVTPLANRKGLDLSYLMMPRTPSVIVQDQTRLQQILVNLLSNAVKFTQTGEVALQVNWDGLRDDLDLTQSIRFSVRDSGIGIPTEQIEQLFQTFSQVDPSTNRRYGGIGLGLAISKLLVGAMGGEIEVESEVGKGSTFTFWVVAPVMHRAPSDHRDETTLYGRHILVVDDNPTYQKSLCIPITEWGMQPTAVGSGNAALELLRSGTSFDLAIVDQQLPDMTGMELAKSLWRARPARQIPIILLNRLHKTSAEESNPLISMLNKPVKITRLHALMRHVFHNATTQRRRVGMQQQATAIKKNEISRTMPLRILVAEDNSINQQLIMNLLDRFGYQADIVTNGQEAVAAVRQQPYDLILMDVQMPVMDGLEATRIIRAEQRNKPDPWIIAVTAGSVEGDRESCFGAGMNDFISKPIEQQLFAHALERYQLQHVQSHNLAVSVSQAAEEQTLVPVTVPDSSCTLDPRVLEQLVSTLGDQGSIMLPALITTFIENANSLQASAQEALEQGDSATLRRAMHTLKSNASTFGATPLSTLCRDMENRAAAGELAGAAETLADVAAEFARVQTALEQLG